MFWYQTCTPIIFWPLGLPWLQQPSHFQGIILVGDTSTFLKYYPGREYFSISKYYSGLRYFGILRYYPGRGYLGISFGTAVVPVLEQRKTLCTGWCTLCQLFGIHWILVNILNIFQIFVWFMRYFERVIFPQNMMEMHIEIYTRSRLRSLWQTSPGATLQVQVALCSMWITGRTTRMSTLTGDDPRNLNLHCLPLPLINVSSYLYLIFFLGGGSKGDRKKNMAWSFGNLYTFLRDHPNKIKTSLDRSSVCKVLH